MIAQLCLIIVLNVVIHHGFATPECSPQNGQQGPEYYPHPTDCSKFFMCDWGVLIEQHCPPGIYWNNAIKACDFPENVNCEPVQPEPSPNDVSAPGICPEEYDPNNAVFLPHVDCSKFYLCTLQGPVEQSCSVGLHWNQNANVCDWPQFAGCEAGSTNPSTTTTEQRSTTTTAAVPTTNLAPVGKCPEEYDPNDEVFLPHTDCTKYYLCTWNGRPVEQSCPAGLHWNANANRCDWPAQAGCRTVYLIASGSELSPRALK